VPPPALHEPRIAIGLAVDLSGVTLGMEGDAVIEGAGRHALKGGEQLSVTIEQGHTVLRGLSSSTRRWMAKASKAETLWVTAEEGTAIQWNGRRWRGQFKIFRSPRGKLTLATRLPLETYLVGCCPGRIGPLADNLVEAGRAQAIAARSFTLYYQGRRGVEGFDLFATVEDQLYGSIDAERPLATQCVEATAGQTALYGPAATTHPPRIPTLLPHTTPCGTGIHRHDVWEALAAR
jgi:stage II sporulation protein D